MKVALVTDAYLPAPGPAPRHTHELAKALIGSGFAVEIFTAGDPSRETLDAVPITRCKPRALAAELDRLKPDVVHAFPEETFIQAYDGPKAVEPAPLAVDTEFFRTGDRKAARRRWQLPIDATQVIVLVDPERDNAKPPSGQWDPSVHFLTTTGRNVRTPLHVKSLYQAANLCLLTGEYPGANIIELEAMASGLAVVRDVDVARALTLDRDHRREIGRAARVEAQRNWKWSAAIEQLMWAYELRGADADGDA